MVTKTVTRRALVRVARSVLGIAIILAPKGTVAQGTVDSGPVAPVSSPLFKYQADGDSKVYGLAEEGTSMLASGDSRRKGLIGAAVGAGIGFGLAWGMCTSAEACSGLAVGSGAILGGLIGAGIASLGDDADEPEVRSAGDSGSWQVSCTNDPRNHRDHVFKMLTDPTYENWRTRVGLTNVNANELAVVTDDSTCRAIWARWTRAPKTGFFTTFFRVGDFYIVTEYPNSDPALGPVALGRGLTTVLDEQLRLVPPVWAE